MFDSTIWKKWRIENGARREGEDEGEMQVWHSPVGRGKMAVNVGNDEQTLVCSSHAIPAIVYVITLRYRTA